MRTSIATPESVGEVAGLGEQAVGDVDHRGRAGLGGDRPGVVRRLRAPVGLDQHARRAEPAAQHGQPAGGPALAPGQGQHVARLARPSARPGDWVHAPSTVTAITIWSARVRSPPTTLAPTSAHSSAKPRAKSSAHCDRQVGGGGQPDGQRGGPPAHGVDVGEVLGGGPVADVGGGGPVAAEVAALDHQVGRDHDVAVAHAQHGGVVARADQHVLALGEERGELARSGRTRRRRRGSRRAGRPWTPSEQTPRTGLAMDTPRGRDRLTADAPAVGTAAGSRRAQPKHEESTMVVQAYILIQTDVGKAAEVATAIAQVKGVTLAEDVTGPYDVIVRAEARNVDELGKLVVAKVQTLDGITRTLTCPVVHI